MGGAGLHRDELLEVNVAVLVEVRELEDLLHLRRAAEITGDAARSGEMRASSKIG